MADSATSRMGLIQPEPGASNGTWGEKLNANLTQIDLAVGGHHLAENPGSHSGLSFAFSTGIIRSGNAVTSIAAGSIALIDNTTNYIEADPADGLVKLGSGGFTVSRIPLYIVVTTSGAISSVADKRAFLIKAVPVLKQWFFSYAGEGTESSVVYLTKGSIFEPAADLKCYGIGMLNSDANTQSIKLRIYELSGTTQVGAALAESGNITAAGEQALIVYEFSSPVTLLAGHRYVISQSNVTSGATYVKGDYIAAPSNKITGLKRNTYAAINNASPANGATWTVGTTAPYGCAMKLLIE